MSNDQRKIFRKEALERMASPDRLDELIRVVSPRRWLMLATLAAVVACVVVWCVAGRLPTTVTGPGALVRPRRIVEAQSQAAGKLVTFNLRVGDVVRRGDVLGVVDQGEIRRQVLEDRARLTVIEAQGKTKDALQQEQVRLQARDGEARKQYLAMQAASRAESLRAAEALAPGLQRRLDALAEAVKRGLEAKVTPELVQAQRDFYDNQTRIADLKAQHAEIESQIKQVETSQSELARTFLEASTGRTNQAMDLRKAIALGEVQLERNTQIVAEHSGRVVDIGVTVGQVLAPGARLASIDVEEPGGDLVSVAYFPVRDGKRIKPGMSIQVTPDTVKRERYGAILGKVVSVSPFPATKEGAALLVGNPAIAALLVRDEPQIEVVAELSRDASSSSGYRWSSSRGPDLKITAGTTTSCRTVVEMRAPITYILPFLRAASGLY